MIHTLNFKNNNLKMKNYIIQGNKEFYVLYYLLYLNPVTVLP